MAIYAKQNLKGDPLMLKTSHPKLRRALACTALVSALSLLPLGEAAAQPSSNRTSTVDFSVRLAGRSLWDVLASLLGKWGPARADRGGNKASVRIDPNGSALSMSTTMDTGDEASVRIDPNGNS
jgi:hypothetical protein